MNLPHPTLGLSPGSSSRIMPLRHLRCSSHARNAPFGQSGRQWRGGSWSPFTRSHALYTPKTTTAAYTQKSTVQRALPRVPFTFTPNEFVSCFALPRSLFERSANSPYHLLHIVIARTPSTFNSSTPRITRLLHYHTITPISSKLQKLPPQHS